MSDQKMQILAAEVNVAFNDIHDFNRLIWSGLAAQLEEKGILSKQAFADWLNMTAGKCEETKPDHPLGANRRDTVMLRSVADILVDPDAAPRWKPTVIQGGKNDEPDDA